MKKNLKHSWFARIVCAAVLASFCLSGLGSFARASDVPDNMLSRGKISQSDVPDNLLSRGR